MVFPQVKENRIQGETDMDKRQLSDVFRDRLKLLLLRSDQNQSEFAAAVGIDRSALSQLLSGASTRLPRAETLLNIAAENKVSLDWLLGLSQDEGLTGEIRESLEIEEASGGFERTLIAKWHAEAAGTKIRYVPAGIPDLLRTPALIDYEADISTSSRAGWASGAVSQRRSAASSSTIWRSCWTTSIRPSGCSSMTASCAIRCPIRSSAPIARRSIAATCIWCSTPPNRSAR